MSDLSDFMSEYKFIPSHFDTILNSHSGTSDSSCNIDKTLDCNCKYYNINSVNEGVLERSDFPYFI